MDWPACKARFQIIGAQKVPGSAEKRGLEENSVRTNQNGTQARQSQPEKNISWLLISTRQKRGSVTGHGGFRKISGAKIHAAADGSGLPVSAIASPANEHGGTKFIDALENISEYLDGSMAGEISAVCADRGYDAKYIRNCCRCHSIGCRIPYEKNSKFTVPGNRQNICSKTGFAVERFLAWLKCGFRRTATRYEGNCENHLGLVYLACIMMYWRVLG